MRKSYAIAFYCILESTFVRAGKLAAHGTEGAVTFRESVEFVSSIRCKQWSRRTTIEYARQELKTETRSWQFTKDTLGVCQKGNDKLQIRYPVHIVWSFQVNSAVEILTNDNLQSRDVHMYTHEKRIVDE